MTDKNARKGTQPINIGFAAKNPPTLDFVLPGYLMRTTGVIIAPGGTGKSMLSLQIAMSVALVKDIFGLFDKAEITQGKVIIFNAEDERELLEMRIYQIAKNFSEEDLKCLDENVIIIPAVGTGFTIAHKNEYGIGTSPIFHDTIPFVEKQKPRLVIFDTMNRMSGGIDENDNGAMGQLMNVVERFNKKVGCASLIIHHASKAAVLGGQGSLQQAGRGASVVTDNARFQLNLSGMSQAEADALGINDFGRSTWVAIDYSKVNYGPPMPRKWLKREEGGWLSGNIPDPSEVSEAMGFKPKKGRSKGAKGQPY